MDDMNFRNCLKMMKKRQLQKRFCCIAAAAVLCFSLLCLTGGASAATETDNRIDEILSGMTLHEKVCQLFFVQPDHFSRLDKVDAPSEQLIRAFTRFPVGGVILFGGNISYGRLADLNAAMRQAAIAANGIGLLIGVDEEGGSISRVAGKLKLQEKQPVAGEITTPEQAYRSAEVISRYLSEYGFNVDFAPVADVRTDVKYAEIANRAYSDDPDTVARMVEQFVAGMRENGLIPVLKHFPGHGAVSGNTHKGFGVSEREPDEWRRIDFVPFRAGIDAGAEIVMMSHQLAVRVDPDLPASLSPKVVSYLRNELEFDGVVITDALRMDAIHKQYSSGEACVMALEAGVDMLLLPYNFTNGYNGVIRAVENGRLSAERIDESVRRILTLKLKHGLLQPAEDAN